MPPKKGKKGKKGRKKDDKRKNEEDDEPEALGFPEDLSRDFYMIKIHDLERMLVKYEEKHKMLQELNDSLTKMYQGDSKERREKVSFLKKTMEQRDDEIAELKDKLYGLQQHKDSEKEAKELELQRLRTDYQEMKDQLTSENNVAAAKLAALEEFKRERESLLAKYQALEDDYQSILDEHKEAIGKITEKKMLDRDRLKKDMVTRVNMVAADFRKVSNKQMADTTKRTIRENVSIQAQLLKMKDKSIELMEENAELRKKNRASVRGIKDFELSHQEHAKKLASHNRLIMMMKEKQVELDQLVEELKSRERHLERLEEESGRLKDLVEEQREEVEMLAKMVEDGEVELTNRVEHIATATEASDSTLGAVRQAADTLKAALQLPTAAEDEILLEKLSYLLTDAVDNLPKPVSKSAVPSRPLTAATESDVPLDEVMDTPTKKSVSVQHKQTTKKKGVHAHCQPGSLQLVPKPDEHISTFSEKVRYSASKRKVAPPTSATSYHSDNKSTISPLMKLL